MPFQLAPVFHRRATSSLQQHHLFLNLQPFCLLRSFGEAVLGPLSPELQDGVTDVFSIAFFLQVVGVARDACPFAQSQLLVQVALECRPRAIFILQLTRSRVCISTSFFRTLSGTSSIHWAGCEGSMTGNPGRPKRARWLRDWLPLGWWLPGCCVCASWPMTWDSWRWETVRAAASIARDEDRWRRRMRLNIGKANF